MFFSSRADVKSLYIHWPFCPYRCHFCPFVALAGHDQYMQEYHKALCAQMDNFFTTHTTSTILDTIYLGGGTPSTYPEALLLDMSGKLREKVSYSPKIEITLEVNPGTISQSKIDTWKEIGVNRISIGIQSLNDRVLQTLNRHQTRAQVYAAINTLTQQFDTVSVDVIVGLPSISATEWKEMLHEIVQWPIQHLSMYFLTVHENTQLYFGVKRQTVTLPCDEEVVEMYYWSVDFLAQHGFKQYEISSFARDGKECKHNKAYWERKPYKGFGLGACSFDGNVRSQNEKNLTNYLEGVMHGKDVTIWSEKLSAAQERLEKIMLGLRQTQGISYAQLMYDVQEEQKELFLKTLTLLEEEDFVQRTSDGVRLTPKALALEHEVIARLSF